MLTYDQFEMYVQDIQKAEEKLENIAAVFDGCAAIYDCSTVVTAVELLSLLMDDTDDWIGYWFFERDHGRTWDENTACDADGTPIICKTVRQLYDFLVKESRERAL